MKIRIGIIGCGSIVQRAYLPGFSEPNSDLAKRAMQGHYHNGCEDAQMIAIADLDEKLANSLAKTYQIPSVFTDWHRIIDNKEIDAVCVATPNYLHAEMVVEALKAGKHVLVEKPMATSIEDADLMVKVADEKNLILMINHSFRFSPIYERAKEVIDSGLIGSINSIRGRFSYAGPEFWTGSPKTWFLEKNFAGGGALFDAGIHAVDLLRFLTSKEVSQVACFYSTLEKNIKAEDNAVAILKFENGLLGTLEASWTTRPGEIMSNVYGSEGNMIVDMGEGSASISSNESHPIITMFAPPKTTYMNMSMPPGSLKIPIYFPEIPTASKNGGPFRHFIHCIKNNVEPITSGKDALKSIEILMAAALSNDTKAVIDLPIQRKIKNK